ncbi:glyoxalase superfamily protein [Pseudoroseicyclus sp. CXY001]|uniref:glyoxalase superfamily protein n=1 Tax=Pseudoroseicyclus sp. CXY001 TaxID=3242492 RepID=UPI00358DD19D
MRTILDAKPMAKALRAALAEQGTRISHAQSLELVARQFGLADWNTLAAKLGAPGQALAPLPLPAGWGITGQATNGVTHRMGLDPDEPGTAVIESLPARGEAPDLDGQIAVLMQSLRAEPWLGRRLRLLVTLRTERADEATAFFRVDAPGTGTMRFDNMMNRGEDGALHGTRDWTERQMVLDVPEGAGSIHYGFFLKGYGSVRARAMALEEVGADVPVTARNSQHLDAPQNLDFLQSA